MNWAGASAVINALAEMGWQDARDARWLAEVAAQNVRSTKVAKRNVEQVERSLAALGVGPPWR